MDIVYSQSTKYKVIQEEKILIAQVIVYKNFTWQKLLEYVLNQVFWICIVKEIFKWSTCTTYIFRTSVRIIIFLLLFE